MGQAAVDLPDPLQHTQGPAGNADDLLSQMAGDEIDRLLAESEADATPVSDGGLPSTAVAGASEPAEPEATAAGAVDLDAVLESAANTTPAEKAALHAPIEPAPAEVDDSPRIELGESRLPLLFRPLEWLSAPLDPWPDQFRDIIGKVGLITLINALGVLAYVLLFRRHH